MNRSARRIREKIEYGDFQTPIKLAQRVLDVLVDRGTSPGTIIEPTCGRGNFLVAALRRFPNATTVFGVEIDRGHFDHARERIDRESRQLAVDLRCADFFTMDWQQELGRLVEPMLIIGNPPWVTASALGTMKSSNLPNKSNFQRHNGLDALTGKANFDIAEWMLIHLLKWASGKQMTLAMIVKSSVARKVLAHSWMTDMPIIDPAMYEFDAREHFGVSVAASLLVCDLVPGRAPSCLCSVRTLDKPTVSKRTIALQSGTLIADTKRYDAFRSLQQQHRPHAAQRWRSGVKHDCSRVMELRLDSGRLRNGFVEAVDVESGYLFPMLKGSAVAKGGGVVGDRFMIVTQSHTGTDTNVIKQRAPKTWDYLCKHGELLDRRSSSIYRNRPRFSVFGVGDYTFAPWKVAICGLYKKLEFAIVGPHEGRPVVFDDTVYHLSFQSELDARGVGQALNSDEAREFLSAFVFWDVKRPITVDVLQRLSIPALLTRLGREPVTDWISPAAASKAVDAPLFSASPD